ncbi:hypothetical protein D3C75_729960 [compost metagenome]
MRQPLQREQRLGDVLGRTVADDLHQRARLGFGAQVLQLRQAKMADHQQCGGDDQRQGETVAFTAGHAQGVSARPQQSGQRGEQQHAQGVAGPPLQPFIE